MERLKYNSSLCELDLRLNPITKEENDYRLFLINIIQSLRVLDDRGIRESERQMAVSFLNQGNQEVRQNGKHNFDSAVVSRVKSVSNIVKRSVGLSEDDDIDYRGSFDKDNQEVYEPKQPKSQDYSPRSN